MICGYCGRVIDDDAMVCPYCGSAASSYTAPQAYEPEEPEEESYSEPERGYSGPRMKLPKMGFDFKMPSFPLSTIISLASAVFSLICLLNVASIKTGVTQNTDRILTGLNQLQVSYSALEDRLAGLDNTIAGVQDQAYNQLASQSISITKDLTSLTGPVSEGKYNQMFIINAKGNLNINTSFDWQKYNEVTQGWVSIVFTGTATTNDEYGLRIENSYDSTADAYVSILWANGITQAGAGTYRCVITDGTGITKTSGEALVQVS